ncbi:uncharacterized protein LOC141909917 [Tubulanus polymorphus]|uniref:uncharacterized protein LOC141909917 n=1 Tax=Tubulanus polymorphus TaxID=672921 RepID=UPI003DA58AD0
MEEAKIIKIQSVVRRFLIQRKFDKLRSLYEDIFNTIEQENKDTESKSTIVTFRLVNTPCRPRFSSRRDEYLADPGNQLTPTPRSSTPSLIANNNLIKESRNVDSFAACRRDKPITRNKSLLEITAEEPTRDAPSEQVGAGRVTVSSSPAKDETLNLTVDASLWEVSSVINPSEDPVRNNGSESRENAAKLFISDDEIESKAGDKEALRALREKMCLEILWIQQAIDSRKNYLKLRTKMESPQLKTEISI